MVELLIDALELLGIPEAYLCGLCLPGALFVLIVAYLYTKDRYKRL